MGDRFARHACSVLAAHELKAVLTNRSTPTPVLSFDILKNSMSGAINFTASHNPPEYNGLKFSPDWGGPALPETTADVEKRANELMLSGDYSSWAERGWKRG
jgi:phosphomannomutase